MRLMVCALVPCVLLSSLKPVVAADEPFVAGYLASGQLAKGAAALEDRIKAAPKDQQARFGLGVVQFFQAIEGLAQAQYRYGLMQHRLREIPVLRLPVPPNENPDEITYEGARLLLLDFVDRLARAEKTLANVDTKDVKLPIHFGRIRLDLDGNGKASEAEKFWKIYANFNRRVGAEEGENFMIVFDGGDVHWLRGYCHLLMAMGEFALAHDWQDEFERTAHLFYPKVKTPHTQLQAEGTGPFNGFHFRNVLDVIAFIHLINFEVVAPQKMTAVIEHLEAMTQQSKLSWERIRAETDNDREWLPNPSQTGVIPGVAITEEMIDSWNEVMTELERVLQGKELLPYWRGEPDRKNAFIGDFVPNTKVGINFRRIFTEPTRFDLVMWVQGTAATPYLESFAKTGKPPVNTEVFERMVRVFQGEFIGFAIWFN